MKKQIQAVEVNLDLVWLGLSPHPVTVSTRIVPFLVGDTGIPINRHLPLLLGGETTQHMANLPTNLHKNQPVM